MRELYGSVGLIAALAQLVYLGAAFVLSTHLLARGRRTGDLAPLLLGVHLLFAMGFGYLLCALGMGTARFSPNASPALVTALLGTGYAATVLGLVTALIFQWRVFWPGERWPLWLIAGFAAAMVVGWAGAALAGAFASGGFESRWVWLLYTGMLGTNLWVGIEPLVYHRKLLKRVPLGLAEPLVADRFLLWGLGSLARAALVLMGPLSDGLGIAGQSHATLSAAVLVLSSALGLGTSVAYWLTFNPTAAYSRWVERRYRVAR
jgi:hypothetical protein